MTSVTGRRHGRARPDRSARPTADSLAVLVAVLAAGCSSRAASPLPPARPRVTVTMHDDRIEHGPVAQGQAVFEVRNLGTKRHRLSLVPLPDELPPIDQQLRGSERATVTTHAAVADLVPGGTGTFATQLVTGRYAMVCFNVDEDGSSHALQGMATEFRIT